MKEGKIKSAASIAFFMFFFTLGFALFYHFTEQKGVVNAQMKDSCVTDKCHTKMGKDKFVHVPVAMGDCMVCHKGDVDKHKSSPAKNRFQLYNEPPKLCFMCHDEKIAAGKFVHTPVAMGACTMCHNPHESNFPKMLMAAGNDVCFTCHTDKADAVKGKKFVHAPVAFEGGCLICHNPHQSDNFRMLMQYYPPVFYAPFDPKNYELCFSCHDKTLALDPKTTTLTEFRNGDQNLHFVHVNKAIKGRTCRACHDAHATNNPKHIRDSVPFGAWELPVGFQKTADGGSCLPGCHQKFEYNRISPVKNR